MNTYPESKWTEPRDDCPHPEYWTSTDPDSTEIEVSEMIGGFVRALQPDLVVETGTAFGQTTEQIGLALHDNGHGTCISYEVDEDRGRRAVRRCGTLPVRIVLESSLEALAKVDAVVDFAWLDSLIELRPRELEILTPKLAPGAIVGIHDTNRVHRLADLLRVWGIEEKWQVVNLKTPRGVMFIQLREYTWL